MGRKSQVAFQFTVNQMNASLYFWTFTTADVVDCKTLAARWNRLLNDPDGLKAAFSNVSGLRVFERHKGVAWAVKSGSEETYSHGYHVHCLVNEYLPVDIVRKISTRKGFGRIHVKQIDQKDGHYLGKYLSKERQEYDKGVRLWAPFGRCDSHKVRDIFVDSRWTAAYQFLSYAVHGFKKLSWNQRCKLATMFLFGEEFAEAMQFKKPATRTEQEKEADVWEQIMEDYDDGK